MGVVGGFVGGSVVAAGVGAWAGALVVQDLRHRRLPDALTLPAVPVVWTVTVVHGAGWAVLGGLGWCLLCILPGLVSTRLRAGGGDAKLALSLGTVAAVGGGVAGLLWTVAAASLVTLAFALIPGVRGRALPHGPGMLVGTAVVTGVINGGVW
ncbi:prepilin peptidase [Corynebacterium sp.]|uniref:prepilin peptidase n=1 Tax=Corynebacterium sp. TaxID=1720 RepID=UPI003B3B947F